MVLCIVVGEVVVGESWCGYEGGDMGVHVDEWCMIRVWSWRGGVISMNRKDGRIEGKGDG